MKITTRSWGVLDVSELEADDLRRQGLVIAEPEQPVEDGHMGEAMVPGTAQEGAPTDGR